MTINFKNESDLESTDISSEEYRVYNLKSGEKVTIKNPLKLNVSANDHRVFNSNWVCHYVLKDVIQIEREVKDGKPLFEK